MQHIVAAVLAAAAVSAAGGADRQSHQTSVFEVGERIPISRLCRHPSGDQRIALALPGTAWLQRDSGPRAIVYRLPMDVREMEATLEALHGDVVALMASTDEAVDSRIAAGEGSEQCQLTIFNRGDTVTIEYSGLDTMSPALANVDRTLDRIATRVLETPVPTWDLDDLEIGDLLRRRADGVLFEYYSDTGDGLGAELHGINQPLIVLETAAELPSLYDHLGATETRAD